MTQSESLEKFPTESTGNASLMKIKDNQQAYMIDTQQSSMHSLRYAGIFQAIWL